MEAEFHPKGDWEHLVKEYIMLRELAHKWTILAGYVALSVQSSLLDESLRDHPGWQVLKQVQVQVQGPTCTCHKDWKPSTEEVKGLLNKVAITYGGRVQDATAISQMPLFPGLREAKNP